VVEEFGGHPVRGGVGGSVGAVDADDGVEVDQAAALVFGDLGVGQPGDLRELALGQAGGGGEQPLEPVGEAACRRSQPCEQSLTSRGIHRARRQRQQPDDGQCDNDGG
jgi:hypothetical protein